MTSELHISRIMSWTNVQLVRRSMSAKQKKKIFIIIKKKRKKKRKKSRPGRTVPF